MFTHHFCRVRQPQEKGHVENAVDYVRSNYMVPMPVFTDFEAFNAHLEEKCREEFLHTSTRQTETVGELFDEEKSFLLTLPDDDFETRRVEPQGAAATTSFRSNDMARAAMPALVKPNPLQYKHLRQHERRQRDANFSLAW